MELTHAKPPKRRRWLIVASLLVLVSLVSWWYWPRGDARFVGKWSQQDTVNHLTWTVVLSRNGSGWADAPGVTGSRFSWRVEGNLLTMGSKTIVSRRPLVDWIAYSLAWLTGRRWLFHEQSREVDELNASVIRFKPVGTANAIIWSRIPE